MTETDWRMKAMADFFNVEFVRVDEDGEPMTTNDATRAVPEPDDRTPEEVDAGKVNGYAREYNRGYRHGREAADEDLDLSVIYMKGWQDGQDAAGVGIASAQWNPLLRVLVNEFGGLVSGESAAETIIRILRESAREEVSDDRTNT